MVRIDEINSKYDIKNVTNLTIINNNILSNITFGELNITDKN